MKDAILEILLEIDPDAEITDHDKPIRDQMALDSMDFLDVILSIRKRYGLDVPESDYPRLLTVNS